MNEEINYFDKIDKIFSPIEYQDPLFDEKIESIGWIKSLIKPSFSEINNKSIFFISDVGFYEKKNFECFKKDFEEIIEKIDFFKLPSMMTKPLNISNYLNEKGIKEINDRENVFKFLKNNEVFTNGISSIIFETLLQKKIKLKLSILQPTNFINGITFYIALLCV